MVLDGWVSGWLHVLELNLSVNPVKGNASDSELNVWGGHFDTTLEMNKGMQ